MTAARVPVLTAATDAGEEAAFVAAVERTDLGVVVARRCVDLADLVAAGQAGLGVVALLSAGLRRLDAGVVEALRSAGVAVVGIVPAGDPAWGRRWQALGAAAVVGAEDPPERVAGVVRAAAGATRPAPLRLGQRTGAPAAGTHDSGAPGAGTHDSGAAAPPAARPPAAGAGGPGPGTAPPGSRLVAVWGPAGAPGRTTVAIGLACELAVRGRPALLVDADVYGGAVAQCLGILDDPPGLVAAVREARVGRLDPARLAGLLRRLDLPGGAQLRVLTGLVRPDRWPELLPVGVLGVLEVARRLAAVVVVDCGFCLEQDEELSYDTRVPRRNGATVAALAAADTVVAVGQADPVGLQRLVRGLEDLGEVLGPRPAAGPVVVVNRVRPGPVPGDPAREVAAALRRHGVSLDTVLPEDRAAADACLATGRCLVELAPASPLRRALAALAEVVDPAGVAAPGRRRWGRYRLGAGRHGRLARPTGA